MVIYEVSLHIQPEIFNEYQQWLKEHVREVLAHEGFLGAHIFRVDSDNAESPQLVVSYTVERREQLQRYLDNHAPAMRAKGIERFGSRFSASRRILTPLERCHLPFGNK